MDFIALQNLCASWLDDVSFGYFTQSQLQQWLNNAQREAHKRLIQAGDNYYTVNYQTTMVVSQTDYVLPDDFHKVLRLEIVVSGTSPNYEISLVEPITINQQDLYPAGNTTPSGYYLTQDRIVLVPPPDQALLLRMWYAHTVTDMSSSTDVPDVPEQYHEYLAILATLDGLYKDGRDPTPFLAKKEYYETLMKQDAQRRREDQPRGIVSTHDEGFEVLF